MLVPKPLKQAGYFGILLVAFVMISAGVPVPWINDYRPTVFATAMADRPGGTALVSARIDPGTLTGGPWDGSDSFGGMLGPVFASVGFASPPDLVLCLVSLDNRRPECLMRLRDGSQISYCVDAYECEWEILPPRDRAWALILFDSDSGLFGGGWDYVDTVLVVDGANPEDFQEIDLRTRLFISYVAPVHFDIPTGNKDKPTWPLTYDRGEKYRREKAFDWVTPAELVSGRRLVQSDISLIPIH